MTRRTVFLPMIGVAIAAFWWLNRIVLGASAGPELAGSGVIQALQDVVVSAEIAGKITAIDAAEGMEIEAGKVLVRLDDRLMVAQLAQVQAAVVAAEANVALLKAGPRDEEILIAEAEVDYAKAQVQIAQAAVAVSPPHV